MTSTIATHGTSSPTARPGPGRSSRGVDGGGRSGGGLRAFKVGAWAWIATGAGHTLGDIYSRVSAAGTTTALDDAMRAEPFDLMGLHRTYYDVTMGFSLAMGTCMVCVGILFLWIVRVTGQQSLRPAALLALAMSAVALGITAWLEPPPPIVLFTLACFAFALAARSAQPREAPAQP